MPSLHFTLAARAAIRKASITVTKITAIARFPVIAAISTLLTIVQLTSIAQADNLVGKMPISVGSHGRMVSLEVVPQGQSKPLPITQPEPLPIAQSEPIVQPQPIIQTQALLTQELPSGFNTESLQNDGLWQELRNGFEFSYIDNKRVNQQIRVLEDGLTYLRHDLISASPYLFHIASELRKSDIPLDIALLPLIESAFNPHAKSPRNAVGLWQFIPATAEHYGLSTDKSYDQRKDAIASTKAAVHLLNDLNRMFDGDWLLALAAYNTGPGKVRSAMRRAKKQGKEPVYWNLELSEETSDYIPRLIAVGKIISEPARYGMELPLLPNTKQIESVSTGRRISIEQVAVLTDHSVDELTELNPYLENGITPSGGPHTLTVPAGTRSSLLNQLAHLKNLPAIDGQTDYITHVVKPGDSLWKISRDLNVDVDTLREWNNLDKDYSAIKAGDTLRIAYLGDTDTSTDTEQAKLVNYRVKPQDTLSEIAGRFDLQIGDIRRWNKSLWEKDLVRTGELLRIPTESL